VELEIKQDLSAKGALKYVVNTMYCLLVFLPV